MCILYSKFYVARHDKCDIANAVCGMVEAHFLSTVKATNILFTSNFTLGNIFS